MSKLTIEYDGNYNLETESDETTLSDGFNVIATHKSKDRYTIAIPQNTKVTVHFEETELIKKRTIENAELKIEVKETPTKYKVGDKFYDECLKETSEIIMVAPTKSSNGDQIYFIKSIEDADKFVTYSSIHEGYFDEDDVEKL